MELIQLLNGIVSAGLDDQVGGEEAGLDGGADSFAALRVGETGGVADEEDAVVLHGAVGLAIETVRVTVEFSGEVERNFFVTAEEVAEVVAPGGEVAFGFATDADVEMLAFAEAPGVAAEVGVEEELGDFAGDGAGGGLVVGHLEFVLLGDDGGFFGFAGFGHLAGDGTEVAPCSNYQRRLDLVIDEPGSVLLLDGLERVAELLTDTAAGEEVVVEFATADAVADGLRVLGEDFAAAEDAGAEAGNRLQHARGGVVGEVELQLGDDGGGDPAGADFVAGEGGFVEDEDVEAGLAELPGAGRAGRAAADDEDVAGEHVGCRNGSGLIHQYKNVRGG